LPKLTSPPISTAPLPRLPQGRPSANASRGAADHGLHSQVLLPTLWLLVDVACSNGSRPPPKKTGYAKDQKVTYMALMFKYDGCNQTETLK